MYSVSSAFNLAIHQPIRVLKSKVVVSGGSTFDDNVIQSITIKRSVIPENGFVLGGVNSTQVTICLLDPDDSISPEDFTGVELTPHIGVKLADETYEYIPMGIFIADQPTRKEGILEIIAFDRMVLLEKPFESAISYPSTPWDILQEIVAASGLVLDNTSILNGDSYIMSAVVDVTMRQMVGYIAEVAGGYAKITRDGKLKIVKFETGTALEEIKPSNYFAPMAVADTALTITGITVRPTPSIVGKTYGATDNPYVSIGNPILKRYPTDTINSLLSSLSTVNYWPFSVEWQGNPALDEGDYITVQDVKTNTVRNTIFGDETLSYSGGLRSAISLSARSAQKNATDTQTSISNQFNSMSGGMDGRPMFGINNHLMADFYGINPDFIKRTNNKVINSGFELHDATTMKPVGWSGDGVASAEEAWEGSKSLKLLSGNIMIQENGVILEGRDRISFRHKGGAVNVRVTSGATTEEYVWSSTTTAHFPSGTVNASDSPTAVKLSDGRVLYMYAANSGIYQAYIDSVENFVSQDNTVVNPTLVEGSLLFPRVLVFNSPDGDLFHIRCYCNNADTKARVRIYKCSVGDGSDWQYYSDVYEVAGYTGNTAYVGSHPLGIHFEGSRWILVAPGLFYDSGWLMESIGISTSDNGGLAWTRRYNNDGLLAMAYLEMCSRNISINMDGDLCWTWSSSAGLGSNVYLTSTDGTSWTQIVSSPYANTLYQSFPLISDGGKQYILRTNDSHLFSSTTQPTVLPLTGDTFDDWTYVDTLPALGFAAGINMIFQVLGNTLVAMKGGWAGVATVLGITIQLNRLHLYDNSTDEGTDEPVAWQDGDSLTYGPQDYWEYATPPALDSIREPEAYITQGFHTFFFESTAVPIYIEFECVDETDPCYIDAVQLEPDFNGKWPSIYMPGLMSVPAETHADTHKTTGSDPISPDDIGAETPTGAQGKVDLAVLPFAGGTVGQVLKKASDDDFDFSWSNESGGTGSFNFIVEELTSASIQAALDSAELVGGGVVLVPAGTYIITEKIKVPSNIMLVGVGNVIFIRSAAIDNILINDADGVTGGYLANKNIKIDNIKFDANNTNFSSDSTSLTFGHANNIIINNCEFYGTNTSWHDLELNGVDNALVKGCYFHGYTGSAEIMQLDLMNSSSCFPWFGPYDNTACKNILISQCIFEGNNVANVKGIGNHTFTANYYPSYIKIEKCQFTNLIYAINLQDVSHFIVEENSFVGCRFAVYFENKSNVDTDWILQNNIHIQTYAGDNVDDRFFCAPVTVTSATNLIGIKFIGNKISGCHTHGIGVTATNVIAEANIITGCGKNGIYLYGVINAIVSGNILTDNAIYNDGVDRADLCVGNNAATASANVLLLNNRVGKLLIGTNINDVIVTDNIISVSFVDNSGGTECTETDNLIAGDWSGGESSYTLPQANESILGGIKAASKADGDTQVVKIDPATGLLYVPPAAAAENGLPAGGTTGQVLGKTSDTDYDVEWLDAASGGVGVATGNYGWKNSWAGIPTTTTSVYISKGALVMPLADIKIMGMNLPIDEAAGNTFKFGIYEVNSSYVQTAIIFESDVMTSIGKAVYVQKFTEVITFLSGHYYIVAAFTTTSGDTYIGACSSSIIYEPYEGGFKGFARLNALPSNGATWGVSVIGDPYATGLLVELIEQTAAIAYQNPIDEPPATPNAMDDEFSGTTLDAKWSWIDQGTATIEIGGGYAKIGMFSSGDNERIIVQAVPTAPYTVIGKIRLYFPNANYSTFGLAIYNSGNGRRAVLGIGTTAGNTRAHCIGFNAATTYATDILSIAGYGDPSAVHYVKINVTTTGFSLYISCDGDEWTYIGAAAFSTWIGAITHVGIGYFRNNSDGVVHSGRCDWFRVI